MKKLFIALLLSMFVAGFLVNSTMASGDKVRGEEGQGDTNQECLNFGNCPYGDENPEDPPGLE